MAMANTRVVRRGAALLEEVGEGYGKDFVYKEHAYYPSAKTAYVTTMFLAFVGLVISTPLNRLVRPLLRKPGQGPNQKAMDSGFFKCVFAIAITKGPVQAFMVEFFSTKRAYNRSCFCRKKFNHKRLDGALCYGNGKYASCS
jgi:hypothetical protein